MTITDTESPDLIPGNDDTPELAEFRARVHAFLLERADPLGAEHPHDEALVVARAKEFQGALFDAGLAALDVPARSTAEVGSARNTCACSTRSRPTSSCRRASS